ncbi:MAG TPA: helix-turn-helix domain-containing protein [Candidatus Deferrimicrobiaceae bacterium]|nr:helix-turn-helix domain-containing protein [Candidatus Deferrimicrobiaceae bacterium]
MSLPPDLERLRMLREQDVSQLAGVSLQTLRNWRSDPIKRARGPRYYKINGSVRYRVSDVLSWLEAGRVEVG